jgi:3-oxoacyl-[acyl-carrier protein] reductase
MDLLLEGKTAIVTASSKGIGRAIAVELAREGTNLILCSRNDESIYSLASMIMSEFHVKAHGLAIDVSRAEDIKQLVQFASDTYGTIDALVCNSGGPPSGSFLSFDDAAWENAFQINLMSVVRLVRESYPLMKDHGGRIITIASSSVKVPIPGLVLSNTFRAGIAGLMKTISMELGEDGILVNTVCPGRILTDRLTELDIQKAVREGTTVEDIRASLVKEIPLGRYGTPEEFAKFSTYLLSPVNSYITGSVFYIDGGMVKAL